MSRADGKDAGFGLLEALVALVIVALALSTFWATIGGAYRASQRAKSYAASIIAARSQLDRMGMDDPLQSGTFTGTYPNRVHWRMTVTPLDKQGPEGAQPPNSPAYWISLEVLDRQGKDLFVLETAKVAGGMP